MDTEDPPHDAPTPHPSIFHQEGQQVATQFNAGRDLVVHHYGAPTTLEAEYFAAVLKSGRSFPLQHLTPGMPSPAVVDLLHLATPLAVDVEVKIADGTLDDLAAYLEPHRTHRLRQAWHPDYVLPRTALTLAQPSAPPSGSSIGAPWVLTRMLQAEEWIASAPLSVVLGGPGSGKSTLLRMLLWQIAQTRVAQVPPERADVLGALAACLPIVIPASFIAAQLPTIQAHDDPVLGIVRAYLRTFYDMDGRSLLTSALAGGGVLLMVDGLDEVPIPTRHDVLRALVQCSLGVPEVRLVVTCRSAVWTDDLAALVASQRWQVQRVLPWRGGQIRHALDRWTHELLHLGFDHSQADHVSTTLTHALLGSEDMPAIATVAQLATTPLLCTLLIWMVSTQHHLPLDRGDLYHHATILLLSGWDTPKQLPQDIRSLLHGVFTLTDLRDTIDQLAYESYVVGRTSEAQQIDGRRLRDALEEALHRRNIPTAAMTAAALVQGLRERGGLLHPGGDEHLIFPHRTFYEYAVGRHLLLYRPLHEVVRIADDPFWREPILLGSSALVQQGGSALDRLDSLLRRLVSDRADGYPKPRRTWYRHILVAAAVCADRAWERLAEQDLDAATVKQDIQAGLVTVLRDREQPLPIPEREQAGFLLGSLGDPRYPVTPDQWQATIDQVSAGMMSPYWCKVPAGRYWIGSDPADPEAIPAEGRRQQLWLGRTFWISRYPITNEQWTAVTEQPDDRRDGHRDHPNQPIYSVQWEDVGAWCSALSRRLGSVVRLPTALEWELAAGGADGWRYPWGDTWRSNRAALDPGHFRVHHSPYAPPVGCYPAGAASCGAEDMAGSVWEWTGTILSMEQVARAGIPQQRQFMVGADPQNPPTRLCCVKGAAPMFAWPLARVVRSMYWPLDTLLSSSDLGFRLVLVAEEPEAPQSEQER